MPWYPSVAKTNFGKAPGNPSYASKKVQCLLKPPSAATHTPWYMRRFALSLPNLCHDFLRTIGQDAPTQSDTRAAVVKLQQIYVYWL